MIVEIVDEYGDYDVRAKCCNSRFTVFSEPTWCPYCGTECKVIYRVEPSPYKEYPIENKVRFEYVLYGDGGKLPIYKQLCINDSIGYKLKCIKLAREWYEDFHFKIKAVK